MRREHQETYTRALTRQPAVRWTDWFEVNVLRKPVHYNIGLRTTHKGRVEAATLARILSKLRKHSHLALEHQGIHFAQARPYAVVTVSDFLHTTIPVRDCILELHYLDSELWRVPDESAFWYTALWQQMSRAVFHAGFRRTFLEEPETLEHPYNYEVLDQYDASASWASCATTGPYKCYAQKFGGGETISWGDYVSRACEEQHNVTIAADMSSHSLSFFVKGIEQCGIHWSPWSSHTSLSITHFSIDAEEKVLWMNSVRQAMQDLLKRTVPSLEDIANSTVLVKGSGWTNIALQALGDVATRSGQRLVIPKHPIYIASTAAAALVLNYCFDYPDESPEVTGLNETLALHEEL